MNIQTKNILTYLLVAIGGILMGWLIFGGTSDEEAAQAHEHTAATEYTCSMHPQIRQNEPGKCPICGMDLTPVSKTGSAEPNPFVLEMTDEAVALSNIQTSRVRSMSAENALNLSGKVQVNEENRSSVTAKFPGRIERLYVNFTGQEIRRGERVASVYSPELISAQRELLEAAARKDRNPQLYEASREKLRLWRLTDRQIEQIENSGEVSTTFDIYSDVSGVVTQRLASLGDYVGTGAVLAEVADLSTVWVVLDAYETDIAAISKGSKITFTTQSVPGREFQATVDYITPLLDEATRSVEIRAVVPNPEGRLKPEMFVNATLTSGRDSEVQSIAIPRTAVLWTGRRSVVYVKDQQSDTPAFEMREIVLGPRAGDMYMVESGLEEGEEVVSNGVFAVDGAAQLSGNYSMMMAAQTKTIEVSEDFRAQLDRVVEAYSSLTEQLVASDPGQSARAAGSLMNALENVDMKLLEGPAHDEWMTLYPTMLAKAREISATTELDAQRTHFATLSEDMIESIEVFGATRDTLYKSYCPMAESDQGANWLSLQKEIRNPYYGDDMLSCGEVKKTYHKGQRVLQSEAAPASADHNQQHQH